MCLQRFSQNYMFQGGFLIAVFFLEYVLLWSAWCSLLNLSSAVSVVGSYNSGLVL